MISVTLDWQGQRSGFSIQPCCRMSRFKEVLANGLGVKLERLEQTYRGAKTKLDVSNDDKFLIEDVGVKPDAILFLSGAALPKSGIFNCMDGEEMMELNVVFECRPRPDDIPKPMVLKNTVASSITGRQMKIHLQQQRLWVPDTIKLFRANGRPVRDQELIFEQKEAPEYLKLEGTLFPLDLLGPNFDFLQNLGVHTAIECVVCMAAPAARKFDCGHLCVCLVCATQVNKCPLCNE